MYERMRVSDIHFIHDTVFDRFGSGDHRGVLLKDTLNDLIVGRIHVGDFPQIQVFHKYGKWWSQNNRRLKLFKDLMVKSPGRIPGGEILVQKTDISQSQLEIKFTTLNGGTSVKVIKPWESKKCPACNISCGTKIKDFNDHWREESHQVKCNICKEIFKWAYDFESHKMQCSPNATATVLRHDEDDLRNTSYTRLQERIPRSYGDMNDFPPLGVYIGQPENRAIRPSVREHQPDHRVDIPTVRHQQPQVIGNDDSCCPCIIL